MDEPIIDWELSNKLAGNNSEHAKEYLILLVNDLCKQLEVIRGLLTNNKTAEIKKTLHYILGGLSYCGATRLKTSTTELSNLLKNDQDISTAFNRFESEVNLLKEQVLT